MSEMLLSILHDATTITCHHHSQLGRFWWDIGKS